MKNSHKDKKRRQNINKDVKEKHLKYGKVRAEKKMKL